MRRLAVVQMHIKIPSPKVLSTLMAASHLTTCMWRLSKTALRSACSLCVWGGGHSICKSLIPSIGKMVWRRYASMTAAGRNMRKLAQTPLVQLKQHIRSEIYKCYCHCVKPHYINQFSAAGTWEP